MSFALTYFWQIIKTGIGIIALLSAIPTLLSLAGINILLPSWGWVAVLVLCLYFAGHLAYREAFEKYLSATLDVTIDSQGCSLDSGWETSTDEINVHKQITVKFYAMLNIFNGYPDMKHIHFEIDSIESKGWQLACLVSEIDLQVQWRRNNVEYLSIPPRELFPRVRIDAKLPYTVPDKNPMQYLARLENLDVTLRLKPKQGDELILPLTFNVGQIHEPIEKRLKTLATHNQRLSSQAIDMLIDYTRSRPEE